MLGDVAVLGLLKAGSSNRQIADELVVTVETVKKHVSHILDKLGLPTAPKPWPAPASWGCSSSGFFPLPVSTFG